MSMTEPNHALSRATGAFIAVGVLWFLTGCSASAPREAMPDAQTKTARATALPVDEKTKTFVFVCAGGYEFVARLEPEVAWVFRPEGTLALAHDPSGSGVKYSDGTTTLWTKGQEALLEMVGAIHRDCRNDPRRAAWEHAKLNGVDFRAVGNEPAWLLQIVAGSQIVLDLDSGATRHVFALPPPQENSEAGETRYVARGDGGEIVVLLRGRACRDSMSGESFDTQVVVTLEGRILQGCGRALH